MIIFFFIPETYIAQIISCACEKMGNTCIIFSDLTKFRHAVKSQVPDLIVCEYTVFNHITFNVYTYMKKRNLNCPLIFYNDPFPEKSKRATYWENTMKTVHGDFFHAEKYRTLLSLIEAAVESEKLMPFIPLLQRPQKTPKKKQSKISFNILPKSSSLEFFKLHLQLSGNMLQIFKVLYENRNIHLGTTEIKSKLNKIKHPIETQTIYTLIMKLRKKINEQNTINADIIHTPIGYRLLLAE